MKILKIALLICFYAGLVAAKTPQRTLAASADQITCDGIQYYSATNTERGPLIQFKIAKKDLSVQTVIKKQWTPFFGDQNNCSPDGSGAFKGTICETVETNFGPCTSGKTRRCTNKEYQISYAACYTRGPGDDEGMLNCYVPGDSNSIRSWRLKNCKADNSPL